MLQCWSYYTINNRKNQGGSINKYLLALNCHQKIGSQTLKKILAAFDDDIEKAWKSSDFEINKKLEPKIAELLKESQKLFDPEKEIEKIKKLNIGYITIFDKSYPQQLKELPDAPVILYIKGNVEILKEPSLAVVGSRKFSPYGKMAAYKLSKESAEAGLVIVSGLALGIDAVAHLAALDANGKTIGVLGCGLDRIYPANNIGLSKKIIETGGAVVSELSPGTPPLRHNFPARNRIIAGLSLGTLVIEAAESSGALITAYEALEYNREVFAVPGNINSETSQGTNRLIQKGAKLVISTEDIFEELNIEFKKSAKRAKEMLPESKEEKIILDLIAKKDLLVDNIIEQSELNVIEINTALTMMEMKGIIENVGGIYRRKA